MELLPGVESKAMEGEIITADEWASNEGGKDRLREEALKRQYDDAMRNMTPDDWARRLNPQASGGLLDCLFGDGFMGWPQQ